MSAMSNGASQVMESLAERKYLRGLLMSTPATYPVVLVGSWARGTASSRWSDIDVLVVGEHDGPVPPPRIQLITMTQAELGQRVAAGNDFAQWALRFGHPLRNRHQWDDLKSQLLAKAPWPAREAQIKHARKKLKTSHDLLAMGDISAAEEEVRFALSHVARAELLARRVFPLSRQELPRQLRDVYQKQLADMMETANSPTPMTASEVQTALSLVDHLVSGSG
jgi:predicted nucleotidyltransferase